MKKTNNSEVMLTIVVGLLIISLVFKIHWLQIAAVILGLIGIFFEFFTEKIVWLWLKFAHYLGKINSTILLSIIFFLFLTPIAFVFKLLRKVDVLKLKKVTENSVYENRNHTYEPKDLENIW